MINTCQVVFFLLSKSLYIEDYQHIVTFWVLGIQQSFQNNYVKCVKLFISTFLKLVFSLFLNNKINSSNRSLKCIQDSSLSGHE